MYNFTLPAKMRKLVSVYHPIEELRAAKTISRRLGQRNETQIVQTRLQHLKF